MGGNYPVSLPRILPKKALKQMYRGPFSSVGSSVECFSAYFLEKFVLDYVCTVLTLVVRIVVSSYVLCYLVKGFKNNTQSSKGSSISQLANRFFRVGTVVLALHDGSDVFLEAAKVLKYSGNELGASVCFGLSTSYYYLCEVLVLSQPYSATLYYFFNTMLLTLLVFHIYWWILICAMITRQLKNRGQLSEDIRSDSEDDD
ncbi:hypothetical protein CASFOL_022193 [Castilleja foliolosa]|uniref:TLC domain-containing protein n=1 Tax=Castilleja foliolosa TaxID=1961234 RepID=A0ABD3CXA4_9LAMI